jgi:hypothetical protein
MRPRPLLSALLCSTLFLLPAVARSGVPSPGNSTVPQCLLGCPAGDFIITIVVRDLASNPVVNSTVLLDFSACPAFTICTPESTDPYIYDAGTRTVRAVTDASGTVRFPLRAGGVCGTANGVSVFADGVYLAGRTFASPDQNGDLFVNAVDQGIAGAKLGAADPTADFDCDGTVTAADLGVVDAHLAHGCSGPTPTRARSWGSVKIIYR